MEFRGFRSGLEKNCTDEESVPGQSDRGVAGLRGDREAGNSTADQRPDWV